MANPLDNYSGKRGSIDVKIRPMPKLADFFRQHGLGLGLSKFDEALEVWRQELQRIFPTDETLSNSITTIINNITQVAGSGSGSGTTTEPVKPFDPTALIAQIDSLASDLAAHIAQNIVHGTSSPVVGETDEQVLERKTIGFSDARNAKFQHAIQINHIDSGEEFTIPAENNMIVAGPFSVSADGVLVVEVGASFAVVGQYQQPAGNVTTLDVDLVENELVVGAGGKFVKTKLSPQDPEQFLNGGSSPPQFAYVQESFIRFTDVEANNATNERHGYLRKLTGAIDMFLRADGTWAVPDYPAVPEGGITQLTGDVTAGPGSGSQAATIPNGTVTYAKMQDVSATDKLLGRSTAGAGDVEEIPCTAAGRAILDDADAAAQRATLGLGSLSTEDTVEDPSDFYFWQEFQGLPNGVNSSAIPGVGINLGSVGSGTVGSYRQGTSTHTPESPYTTASAINSTVGVTAVTGAFGIFPYARQAEFVAWATMNETADFAYWIGLTSAAISAVSATQTIPCALFRLGINGIWTDTNWQVFVHNGSSSETIDTGVAYSSTASVKFEIRWDGTTTGKLKFYINSTLVATSTIDLTSSQGLGPLMQVATRANPGTKTLYVGGFKGRVKYY